MPRSRIPVLGLMLWLSLLSVAALAEDQELAADAPFPLPAAAGHYVVAMSAADYRQPEWCEVATILRAKYEAALVILPDNDPRALLPVLRELRPSYLCLVGRPEFLHPQATMLLHRLARALDDDPYADLQWGILTGYEAADAKRIALRQTPLAIHSGYSSMGPALAASLGAGFATSETDARRFWHKRSGDTLREIAVPLDPTVLLAEAFTHRSPDLVITSGHASAQSWEIGYTVPAGRLLQRDGQLLAESLRGTRTPLTSPGVKVYLAPGNCDIGQVRRRDCMATAWMHSGGVHQMVGYTVVTFFGYMGWGVQTYFERGEMSLAQAFMANNQALIHRLRSLYPEQADLEFDSYDGDVARRYGVGGEVFGLLWDRDAVAFYGDPAWVARMPIAPRGWTAEWATQALPDGRVETTLSLRMLQNVTWGDRPVILHSPQRLATVEVVGHTAGFAPVVTDDFVLLPPTGRTAAGEVLQVTYRGRPAPAPRTTGDAPVIDLR